MESKNKIISIINQIILLLEFSEEEFWLAYFKYIQKEYINVKNEEELCNSILKLFQGGMGSLNDLVLHKDGKPLIDENNKLDFLKDQLFDYCMSLKK